MTNEQRVHLIKQVLTESLSPVQLTIIDESDQHIGHPGHQGAGHFNLTVVSQAFENLSVVARHQLVYKALSAYMGSEIHALSIVAKTPNELKANNGD